MKKIILHSFFCAVLLASFASCSKEVKSPSKVTTTTAASKTTTTTGTQTISETGHTCGGNSYQDGGHP